MTDIQWPWQYNFPPFFTIQPNLETRQKQLEAWRNLILQYYKQTNQYILDLSDVSHSALFNNASISRGLGRDDVLIILEFLAKNGNAEPLDKQKNRWYIYWHSLLEWANIIYNWVQKSNQSNTVLTCFEIRNTPNEEFTGLNEEVLVKVLKLLEAQGKAEVMELNDSSGGISGVKFFD